MFHQAIDGKVDQCVKFPTREIVVDKGIAFLYCLGIYNRSYEESFVKRFNHDNL